MGTSVGIGIEYGGAAAPAERRRLSSARSPTGWAPQRGAHPRPAHLALVSAIKAATARASAVPRARRPPPRRAPAACAASATQAMRPDRAARCHARRVEAGHQVVEECALRGVAGRVASCRRSSRAGIGAPQIGAQARRGARQRRRIAASAGVEVPRLGPPAAWHRARRWERRHARPPCTPAAARRELSAAPPSTAIVSSGPRRG